MMFRCLWSRSGIRDRGLGTRVLLIALLSTAVCCAPVSATELTATLKTPYFTVRYSPSEKALAQVTADTAQRELVRISGDLGYNIEPNRPIPLKVYSQHHLFIKEGAIRDRFTVGTARTGDETISIDASGALADVREVLSHEIAHAVIFRVLGSQSMALPLWANEGLAKLESRYNPGDDEEHLAEAAAESQLIPLNDLRTAFPKDGVALAYAESSSAIRYLVKQHGDSAPRALLAELAKTGSFDSALQTATGKTETAFVRDWSNSLNKRFDVARALRIAASFLWPVMAVLAIIAFIVRRKRMREAARRWDWEEFEESMERQLREWPHR